MARLSGPDQRELHAVKRLCYEGRDSASLREAVGERLRRHLRADAFAFLALEPASGLPVHAVHDWPTGMCDAAHERALLASPAADFGRRGRLARRAHRIEELVSGPGAVADPYLAAVLRLRRADGRARDLVLIEPGRLSDGEHVLPALGLTARERQVAMAVLRGLSTKEIAAAIRLSPHTVQTHVRHIFDKVGVDSRRALASVFSGLHDGAPSASTRRSG